MNFLKLKTTSFFGCFVAILSLSILLTSCEKTEDVINTTAQQEEGNQSTTNNDTKILIDENTELLKPVMQMRINPDLSEEEAEAKWESKVKNYIAKLKIEEPQLAERGVSTELIFTLKTRTGSQSNNGTDADVFGRLNFASNRGNLTTKWFNLDNSGDDREEGDWDIYYLLKAPITGSSITYARARWAQLALKGTDGWFPTDFDIHIHSEDQTVSATGSSHIYSSPNVWLDNSSSSGWDYYNTGTIGYGNLTY